MHEFRNITGMFKNQKDIQKLKKNTVLMSGWRKSAEYRNYQKKKPNETEGLKITEIQKKFLIVS